MTNVEKIRFKEDAEWKEYDSLYLDALKFEGSKRGISFISVEGQNRLTDDKIKGFSHRRFKANFIVNGIDVSNLVVGQLLQIGEATVKVSKVEKDCLDECPVIKDSNMSCLVNKQAFFGQVLREGSVNQNDHIVLL